MKWLENLFLEQTAIQAVIIISIIIACGLALGKVKIRGISLGVTYVFFMGILAGHLGFEINHDMLMYAQNFGLVIFVYALGIQVGPGFFGSLRQGGMQLNMLGLGLIFLGTLVAIGLSFGLGISMGDMMGILAGAVTNTPVLAAAQQTLEQFHIDTSTAALGCAVAYPLGTVGVILAIIILDKFIVKPKDLIVTEKEDHNKAYIAGFEVCNPGIYGKDLQKIAQISPVKFIVTRLWREGKVQIPVSTTVLQENDRILVIAPEKDMEILTALFGEQENRNWNKDDIDWNAIDSNVISKQVIITKPEYNGKKLGALRLRNHYGISITRINRAGIHLIASPNLILQLGDRLTIVGEAKAIEQVERALDSGNGSLRDPNLASVFLGIVLGLILGQIPIMLPAMGTPVKLGLAGGPVIVGILMGAYGPRFKLVTYATRSANLMIRGIGLALFLACLGLDAGPKFFDTVLRPEGALWVGAGFVITVLPVIIMGWISMRICKLDFGHTIGMLCGSMANPMALNYANSIIDNDNPSVSYATVYPIGIFTRVILAQIVLMIFLS